MRQQLTFFCRPNESRSYAVDVFRQVEPVAAEVQARPLHPDQLVQRLAVPVMRVQIAAGKQHGCQHGAPHGRWRVGGNVPVVDIGNQGWPLDCLVRGKIVHGQRTAAVPHVCGNDLGQFALVEDRGAAPGNRGETVCEMRDMDRAATVVKHAAFVVQCGMAVFAATEDKVAAVAEIVMTGCR